MCQGESIQSQDFKNYTIPGLCPPVYKLLDPPLLTPNFLIGFKLCYVSRYLKDISQQNLVTGNLRSEIPKMSFSNGG